MLHDKSDELTNVELTQDGNPLQGLGAELLHMQAEIDVDNRAVVTLLYEVKRSPMTPPNNS